MIQYCTNFLPLTGTWLLSVSICVTQDDLWIIINQTNMWENSLRTGSVIDSESKHTIHQVLIDFRQTLAPSFCWGGYRPVAMHAVSLETASATKLCPLSPFHSTIIVLYASQMPLYHSLSLSISTIKDMPILFCMVFFFPGGGGGVVVKLIISMAHFIVYSSTT